MPDFIVNQIAAGEVVQRSESAVKELVENSLDAGATEIAVIIKDAGKQLIHIIDNGSGMSRDDLALSIKRHSTSKIYTLEDLEAIRTFGFRGEALASICSVALVEIRTKQAQEKIGWKLISEPLKEPIIEPTITDNGMQVFIKNLFYNVPARRKFLRSNLTEFRYISDIVMKFAISHYDKRFTFYDYDQLVFDLHPSDLQQRVIDLLGAEIQNRLIPVNYDNEYIKITGFIGTKEVARQTRSNQYLFLNGRSIINRSINFAIYSCFESILDKNKHPLYVLMLEIDPKKVDVNIHPQKNEVKFDDDRFVFNSIFESIIKTLKSYHQIPELVYLDKLSQFPIKKEYTKSPFSNKQELLVNKITGEIIDNVPRISPQHSTHRESQYRQSFDNNANLQHKDISAFDLLFKKPTLAIENEDIEDSQLISTDSKIKILGQFADRYILATNENGLLIIDQSSAHERIIYESYQNRQNSKNAMQNLLFPLDLSFRPDFIHTLQKIKNELLDFGFDFEIKPENKVTIKSIPTDIPTGREIEIFKELITELSNIEINEQIENTILLSYAKTLSIKAGTPLTIEEMGNLLNNLFNTSNPFLSPSNKRIMKILKKNELDAFFAKNEI